MEFETKSQKAIVIKFPLNHWQKFGKGFWFKTYQVKIIFRVSVQFWYFRSQFFVQTLFHLFYSVCRIVNLFLFSVCNIYFFFINTCTLIFHWNLVKYDFSSIKFRKMLHWKEFYKVISPETCLRKKETKTFYKCHIKGRPWVITLTKNCFKQVSVSHLNS